MTTPFYQQIHTLHEDLDPDQLGRLRVFLTQHGALEFYEEMVNPTEPEADAEARDAAAITQGLAISQSVPDDAWPEFEAILGPQLHARFEAALDVIRQQFTELLGG